MCRNQCVLQNAPTGNVVIGRRLNTLGWVGGWVMGARDGGVTTNISRTPGETET